MLGVYVGHLGASQAPDDDAVAVTVDEGLALGVFVHHDGLASLRPREAGEREPVRDPLACLRARHHYYIQCLQSVVHIKLLK